MSPGKIGPIDEKNSDATATREKPRQGPQLGRGLGMMLSEKVVAPPATHNQPTSAEIKQEAGEVIKPSTQELVRQFLTAARDLLDERHELQSRLKCIDEALTRFAVECHPASGANGPQRTRAKRRTRMDNLRAPSGVYRAISD